MKKFVFAVATALVMSLSFSACSNDKVDAALDEYEKIVEKIEKATKDGDQAAALSVLGEVAEWTEKYKDLDENDFSDAQKKRLEELTKRASALN